MVQIGSIRVKTSDNTVEIPVFEPKDLDDDSLRIKTENGIGAIPVADISKADHPEIRINTGSGIKGLHNSTNDSSSDGSNDDNNPDGGDSNYSVDTGNQNGKGARGIVGVRTGLNTGGTNADYFITTGNGNYVIKNGPNGSNLYSDANVDNVFNELENLVGDNDYVYVDKGTYPLGQHFNFSDRNGLTWESHPEAVYEAHYSSVDGSMFYAARCQDLEVFGGKWNYRAEHNPSDNNPGTQVIFSMKNGQNIHLHDIVFQNAENGFLDGNGSTGYLINNCYGENSNERGFYISEGAEDIECHHNWQKNIYTGAYRSNEGPLNWHIHDNINEMKTGKATAYLFGTGVKNVIVEHDTVILNGSVNASTEAVWVTRFCGVRQNEQNEIFNSKFISNDTTTQIGRFEHYPDCYADEPKDWFHDNEKQNVTGYKTCTDLC